MVTGGDIIHAPCTCKCCIHVNDGCDRSLFKKRTKTNKKSLNPSVPTSLLFWKEVIGVLWFKSGSSFNPNVETGEL